MKNSLLALAAPVVLTAALAARAGPEEDRLQLIQHYKTAFPDIQFDEYAYGALVFDPDAMSQYKNIMQLPPFASELEQGEQLWKTPLKSGKTYADCLPNGGRMIAGNYPMFDAVQGKVVTLEDAVNRCRTTHGEAAYAYGDAKTMGRLTAHLRTLSNGMKMNIKVEGEDALKAYEDGKKTFFSRVGQYNFSCASCHVDNVGNRLRSELISPALGQSVHWPVFRGGDTLMTLQKRYEECHRNMRHAPDNAGSSRYNNLEYFHAYLSNGLPLQAAVFRK